MEEVFTRYYGFEEHVPDRPQIHANWFNAEYWQRNQRYIDMDYSPRLSAIRWQWPEDED